MWQPFPSPHGSHRREVASWDVWDAMVESQMKSFSRCDEDILKRTDGLIVMRRQCREIPVSARLMTVRSVAVQACRACLIEAEDVVMREDFASSSFLAVIVVGLIVLCTGFLALGI